MQTLIPSQQASQVCGSAINLLQTVAGHVHSLRFVSLSTPSATVSKQPFLKSPAAQLLTDCAVTDQLRVFSATHNCHPFSPPTARSTILAPYLNSFVSVRSFHQSHSQLPKASRWSQNQYVHRHIPLISLRRNLSLFGQQPVPSPQALAHIHLLETTANASPTSVSAQVAYFKSLIDSGLPRALERVTSRWERMIEFDQTNPVLRSTEAFQLYLTALVRSDPHASVDHAVKRRDQVLITPTTTTVPTSEVVIPSAHAPSTLPGKHTEQTLPSLGFGSVSASSIPDSPSAPLTGSPPPQSPSAASQPPSSQQVAQSVLATHAATPSTSFVSSLLGNKSKWFGLGGGTNPPPTNPLVGVSGITGGGRENPIYVTVAEPKGSMVYRLIRFIIFTALGAFFTLVIFAVLLENSGLLKAGPKSTAEFEPVEGKVVKFSDVHGVDEAKDELQEIVAFLRDPTSFSTLGGKLPKGVLLTGPPGTGKTLLARAVAGEAGVPFLFASGSEFDEMFVGVGAKRIRDLFAAARKKQPAIIFIDELDAIGSKRSPRDQHYVKQTLNQLLVEMDGFQQSEGVIVIGATNFPQSLDQALVRPGRFDRKITVPLPDIKGRVQILMHHMRNVITSDDVDAAVLARGTPGFSGADLENMVNQAAVKASRDGCDSILLRHFEWAKDRIIMGAERRSTYIAPKVKRLTAYHEGGHALVALYTDGAMPLHKVTCMPRGDSLGHTSQLPEDDRYSVSFKEYIAEMDVCMGGRIAEELIYGAENTTSGCYSDLAYATDVASRLVQFYGFSNKLGPVFLSDDNPISAHKRQEIESEVRLLLEASQERARRILAEREEELHRLADALVEYETLDLDEVKRVVKGEPIRENERLEEIEV